MASPILFSTFVVTKQAFFRTATTAAIVNLKPLVPGHVLVIPTRVVPRFADLTPSEVATLFTSVQIVGKAVEKAYNSDGLTIACQDGKAAGQSVSHVHVHIIPRKIVGDRFANNDNVYPELEAHDVALQDTIHQASVPTDTGSSNPLSTSSDRRGFMIDDEHRKPRSLEDMEREAEWLRTFLEGQSE